MSKLDQCCKCGGDFGGLYSMVHDDGAAKGPRIMVFCYRHIPWKSLGYSETPPAPPHSIQKAMIRKPFRPDETRIIADSDNAATLDGVVKHQKKRRKPTKRKRKRKRRLVKF